MGTMKQKILFITILLLGSFLRFYKLSSIPCLPSALAGTISILLIYFLVKKLFCVPPIALLSALLLAITPWSIHFSRFASEANIALSFFLFATVLLFHWRKHPRFYWLFSSGLFFFLASLTHHSYKLFIPCFLLFIAFIYRRRLLHYYQQTIPLAFIAIIGFSLLIFSSPGLTSVSSDFIQVNQRQNFPWLISPHAQTMLQNYLTHFHPNFLFLGENLFSHYHAPENGFLLYFSAPFLLIGLYQLASRSRFLLGWLLISPLAATFTTDAPMAVQAQLMLIPLTLITAYGLKYLFKKKRTVFLLIACCLLTVNLIYYLQHYFITMPREQNLHPFQVVNFEN
jgi:4-amino-4-deoxy-L-arabinose transferase-like glycosyltransferase